MTKESKDSQELSVHQVRSRGEVVDTLLVPFSESELRSLQAARTALNDLPDTDKQGLDLPNDYGLLNRGEALDRVFMTMDKIDLSLMPEEKKNFAGGDHTRRRLTRAQELLTALIPPLPKQEPRR